MKKLLSVLQECRPTKFPLKKSTGYWLGVKERFHSTVNLWGRP